MHTFFDTEFTQFRDGQLLSIGFVTENGRTLYVEVIDPIRHAAASDFCQNTVIPQFGLFRECGVTSDAEVGDRVSSWLLSLEAPIVLCYDYKLDWRFLEHCLRTSGKWSVVSPIISACNIASIANHERCLAAQENYFNSCTNPSRHHALIDAFALRERWRAYCNLSSCA